MHANDTMACDESSYSDLVITLLEILNPALLVFGTLAFLTNSVFLVCLFIGVHRNELPLKRFLFVANRSIADVITSCVVLAYLYYSQTKDCNNVHLGCTSDEPEGNPLPLQIVITLDYWAVAGSYSGIAMLTWYAVRSPLGYRINLTSTTVVRCIVMGWMSMAVVLLAIMTMTNEDTNFDSNGMIYIILHRLRQSDPSRINDELQLWLVDLCHNLQENNSQQSGTIALLLPIATYLVAFLSYMLVSFVLYRRRDETRISKRHFSCIWRLGIHLGLFTFTCCLMALAYYATSPMQRSCLEFIKAIEHDDAITSWCGASPLFRYSLLATLASIGWFARMCIDPIIDMIIDSKLRSVCTRSELHHHKVSTFTLTTTHEHHKASSQLSRLTLSDANTTL